MGLPLVVVAFRPGEVDTFGVELVSRAAGLVMVASSFDGSRIAAWLLLLETLCLPLFPEALRVAATRLGVVGRCGNRSTLPWRAAELMGLGTTFMSWMEFTGAMPGEGVGSPTLGEGTVSPALEEGTADPALGEGTVSPALEEGTVLSLHILTWVSLSPDRVPSSTAVIALIT